MSKIIDIFTLPLICWDKLIVLLTLSLKKLKFTSLKVQSRAWYNGNYMIALTQITNTEIFLFIAVLVFKLLSRKVLSINRKNKRNC